VTGAPTRLFLGECSTRARNRILESGNFGRREISMKKMIALSMLVLSACAGPSANMRSPAGAFAGPWHGVLAKGEARSSLDFRFSATEGGYQGFYWGRALTPIVLSDLHLGHSVHFEIPQIGVFDGISSGETMEGTFRDGSGEGSFRLEKQLDWDDPRNAP
jgi:hypothetical protein